ATRPESRVPALSVRRKIEVPRIIQATHVHTKMAKIAKMRFSILISSVRPSPPHLQVGTGATYCQVLCIIKSQAGSAARPLRWWVLLVGGRWSGVSCRAPAQEVFHEPHSLLAAGPGFCAGRFPGPGCLSRAGGQSGR